jgi:hypothetical protein
MNFHIGLFFFLLLTQEQKFTNCQQQPKTQKEKAKFQFEYYTHFSFFFKNTTINDYTYQKFMKNQNENFISHVAVEFLLKDFHHLNVLNNVDYILFL